MIVGRVVCSKTWRKSAAVDLSIPAFLLSDLPLLREDGEFVLSAFSTSSAAAGVEKGIDRKTEPALSMPDLD